MAGAAPAHADHEPVDPHLAGDDGVSGEDFVPYVPAHMSLPEMTVAAVVLGLVQAVLFGLADAYLALKVGMTVGASIPAAVISMFVLRVLLKRGSILENNVVQNMASVGESLAAGASFTLPSLFILDAVLRKEGSSLGITLNALHFFCLACIGGLLGILFMIPLRRSLIVKEHGKLRYPEGTACAEVLIAGAKGGDSAAVVFQGIIVSGLYRFAMNGLGLFQEVVAWPIKALSTALSFDLLPSLLAVGYIIGMRTSAVMMSGAFLGWFVLIPLIAYIGAGLTVPVAPATDLISAMDPGMLHAKYLKYIGAGAVAMGGLISLGRSLPTIVESFGAAARELMTGQGGAQAEVPRTHRDIPTVVVLGGGIGLFLVITGLLYVLLSALGVSSISPLVAAVVGGVLAVVFAFFFVTVSSRIVGIVGVTSMPLSGMTIGALICTCLVLKSLGVTGTAGVLATLCVGAIVCIAISMGGDISQDLKIGFLIGATPRVVQITQMISVLVAAISVSTVVIMLAPLVVRGDLPAPQSNLMVMLARGIMGGQLPWGLLFVGMGIAVMVEMMGLAALPFAVGLYLPLELSTTVLVGGILHELLMHRLPAGTQKAANDHGLLAASGLVAGDALVGVVLGIMAARDLDLARLVFPQMQPWQWYNWPAVALFAGLCYYLWRLVLAFGRQQAQNGEVAP